MVLEFDNLSKRYGETTALRSLSFSVQPGAMFGFVGANGAGKTTAMRIAMGVLAADSGEVRWRSAPVTFDTQQRFGYMPEERGLYPKMRVGEQITYFGQLHGLTEHDARMAAQYWTGQLGVAHYRDDPLERLSLGNQQRVQLAVALVHNPEILILDEPFSGLDPVGVDALTEVLLAKCQQGVPVLFSSHQLDLVERLCDSVGIISNGHIVASGSVADLRARNGRRRLRIVVTDAGQSWADGLAGAEIISERSNETLLELDDPSNDQKVLEAALKAGKVSHFSWQEPTLTELFREAVAE